MPEGHRVSSIMLSLRTALNHSAHCGVSSKGIRRSLAPGEDSPSHRMGAVPGEGAAASAREIDVVLIDTAGRLHTKVNLMDELEKLQRVSGRKLNGAPHEVWLVLDATTGQNAIAQALPVIIAAANSDRIFFQRS